MFDVSCRAVVKSGLTFSTMRPSDPALWDMLLEPSPGHAPNRVSVVCKRKVAITAKRSEPSNQHQSTTFDSQIKAGSNPHQRLPDPLIQNHPESPICYPGLICTFSLERTHTHTHQKDFLEMGSLTLLRSLPLSLFFTHTSDLLIASDWSKCDTCVLEIRIRW